MPINFLSHFGANQLTFFERAKHVNSQVKIDAIEGVDKQIYD